MILIDTSSLVALARYYGPLQQENCIYNLLKAKIESGEIIVLDAVASECSTVSKGLATHSFPFIEKAKKTTDDLIPIKPSKFDRMVNNNFCKGALRNVLIDEEFVSRKNEFHYCPKKFPNRSN